MAQRRDEEPPRRLILGDRSYGGILEAARAQGVPSSVILEAWNLRVSVAAVQAMRSAFSAARRRRPT
ncbi:MAG: hypothetical protein AAF899_06735 [Pseudomonadota bacterium]